jgi:hypothetical protein
MTLHQRRILKSILNDTDKRIDMVYYLRGGTSSQENIAIDYTQFRRDGSGVTVKLQYAPDGYCLGTLQVELATPTY